jgi:RsiW-degrading membrane proteinase PrsW (M82 family)
MNFLITYLIYLFFGVLPSFLWLCYYLRKDREEPEPKLLLVKIFILGGLITVPTVSVQQFVLSLLKTDYFTSASLFLIISLLLMALIEESAKFIVIKFGILKDKEFDEPIDGMIYMMTSALGFAAAENFLTLIFVSNESFFDITTTIIWENVLQISLVRFLGATLLHALCSGIIGFVIGLSFHKKKEKYVIFGLLTATILHALYNLSIMKLEVGWNILNPFILLVILYLVISFCFKKLKENNNE